MQDENLTHEIRDKLEDNAPELRVTVRFNRP